MEPTGKDLVDFWNWAADKGLVHRDTAGGLRSACKTVLSTVEPEGWGDLDLRQIDLDPFVSRFERLKQGVKPQSLRVYEARFRSALASYLSYLDSPSTWQFRGRGSGGGAESNGEVRRRPKAGRSARPAAKGQEARGPAEQAPTAGEVEMITHRVPLRPNLIIPVTLPVNLMRSDVRRLTAFLTAVAFDVPDEPPADRLDEPLPEGDDAEEDDRP